MSLVSGYSTSYINPADSSNSSSTAVAAVSSSPFYPPEYASSGPVGASAAHHQAFFSSPGGWSSWPTSTSQQPDYHHHHSPPLSTYSSASPEYHNYQHQYPNSASEYHHHQQQQHPSTTIPVSQQHPTSTANSNSANTVIPAVRIVRVVKRRNTANKKERRRTMSINNAFSELRDCIPNVPADTKLSKIKTLRLATSYISYLMAVLEAGSEADIPFRAELGRQSKSDKMAAAAAAAQQQQHQQQQQHHHHYDNSSCYHSKEQVRYILLKDKQVKIVNLCTKTFINMCRMTMRVWTLLLLVN